MRKTNRVLIASLFIVNCFLGAYVFFNFFNIPNAMFNPIGEKTLSFNPAYPQQSGNLVYITTSDKFLNIDVHLTGTDPIVAKIPVSIVAVGSASSSFLKNVEEVWVGFDGAEPYGTPSGGETLGGSFGGVILKPNQTNVRLPMTVFFGQYLIGSAQRIVFPNPTTYVLIMKILYNNFAPPLILTYPSQTLYANPPDYFSTQRTIRFDYAVGLMAAIDIIAASAARLLGVWKNDQSENNHTVKPTIRKQNPASKPQPKNVS